MRVRRTLLPVSARSRLTAACAVLTACFVLAGTGAAATAPAKATTTPITRACKAPAATAPNGPSAQAEVVQPASGDEPEVAMVRYPRPDREPGTSNPWSQWGQGLVLADGRFLSAIGDHAGVDGNSYLFVYEPGSSTITRFGDVLSEVEHDDGAWGYGKIHGQIVPGRCGEAYFATYWGTRTDLEYGGSYRGDLLFRIDLATLEVESLGVPLEAHGIPSLAGLGTRFVYGEAVDPKASETEGHDVGAFFVYDTRKRAVVFRSDNRDHALFRNVMLDDRGRAYAASQSGKLLEYERGSTELHESGIELPGGGPLRASTVPAPDGTVYGVTEAEPNELFALGSDGTVRSLGEARGYTASIAMEPDGSRLYYVPEAHGDSFEQDTPVIAVDTRSGEQHVVTRLNPLAEDHLNLTVNGSYSISLDGKRHRLYVGLNAGADREEPWGEVVLAVVTLPS